MARLLATLALLVLLTSFVGRSVEAQQDGPAAGGFVVVDLQQVLRDSRAVQALQASVAADREAFQAEIMRREEDLRELDQQLARERATLPAEVYDERRQELAALYAALQSDVQQRRRRLDHTMNEGMRQVQAALLPIIQALAEERGALLVLSKSAVVLVRPELEITDQALERLDSALPEVTLSPN